MINTVTLIGKIKEDLKLETSSNGVSKVNFQIGHSEVKFVDGVRSTIVHWFDCVAYGSLAQLCAEYLSAGCKIGITGTLKTKKNGVEILVKDIEFLGKI